MTKKRVIALAKKLGCKIEYGYEGRTYQITVDAPPGCHWESTGNHALLAWSYLGSSLKSLWEEIYRDMVFGDKVSPCCEDECCSWYEGRCDIMTTNR